MKLLQLDIHNIASIEDATIDFSQGPLADTELFLITGKTGSGKSTILDAICLALYANTPRMNSQKKQEETIGSDTLHLTSPLQLLRKNTGEGYVSLLFEGNNGVQYKARWEVHRKGKKADGNFPSDPLKWTLENLNNNLIWNQVTPIRAEIKEAVGLDFDQFCRTTLLAQGKFTEFLNSKDDEKAAILEKITGVDIYTKIGKKIFSKWSDIDKEYGKLQDKMGDIQLHDLLKEQQQLTTQHKQLQTESQQQQELADAADKAKGNYEAMAKNADVIYKQQTKISNLQQEYNHILDGVGYIKQQVCETSKQISTLENLIQSEASKAPVYQEQPAIAAHVTTILNNTSKRTQYLSNQNKKAQELTPKNNELTNAKTEADAAKDALENHLEDQKKLDEQLEKADLPTKRRQKEEKISEKTAVEQLERDVKSVEDINKQIADKRERIKTIEQVELPQLNEDKKQKESEKIQAEGISDKADLKKQVWADTINDWAKAMRQKLNVGDTCPVCRQQVTHVEVESQLDQNYQKAVEEYNTAKKAVDNLIGKIAEINAKITIITNEQTDKQGEIKKLEKDIVNLQDHCKSQCEKYKITYSDDIGTTKKHIQEYITQVDAEIRELKKTIEDGEEIEKQLRNSDKKRTELQDDKEKKENRVIAINDEIARIQEQVDDFGKDAQACTNNINEANAAIHQLLQDTTWQHDWKTEPEAFAKELKEATDQYQENNDKLKKAQQNKELDDSVLSSVQTQINELLKLYPEWQQIVATNQTNIPDIQKEVNTLVADLKTALSLHAGATRDKAEAERKYNTYIVQYPIDESTPVLPQLEERIQQFKTKEKEYQQKIGEINATLKQNEEKRTEIDSLREKMQQLEGPKAMWNKLCKTLGLGNSDGKEFRKIAQSYVLNNLVNAANRYLAMLTDSRYRLTNTLGSLLILIEDAQNAYSQRSTGTISGGESFLVSLSLALALSDIGTLSVDTLFIDEGFGSLSGEALDNAINTLYSLHRTCGRKVGIISHIEELRERIPVKIQVEQQANLSSSKVTIVS